MKTNQQARQGHVKVIVAAIGGSAVVAMALTMAVHEEQATGASGGIATGATFIQGGGSSMTMGGTATTTTPPASPATSVATPQDKAKPFGGAGS